MSTNVKPAAVVLEGQTPQCQELAEILSGAGLGEVCPCEHIEEAIIEVDRLASEGRLVLVIADLQVPGGNDDFGGWTVLARAEEVAPHVALGVYSAYFDRFGDVVRTTSRTPRLYPFPEATRQGQDQELG